MPFKNLHTARIKSPGLFEKESFRTKILTSGITAVMGRLKGKKTLTIQSYRFDSKKFTVTQDKKWLKEHKINSMNFEKGV